MQYLKNIIIAITILLGLITFAQSETSWIKKKEVKENKKKFNEKNKNISNDVKSWITKKSKEKYVSFENLPLNSEFYFIAKNEDTGESIYGYINSKKDKFFEYSNFYKNSEGFGFINDGKTICKIGSEINAVVKDKIYGEVHVNCGKLKFNGDFAQSQGEGSGTLKSKNGEVIRFDFYKDLKQASISFAKQQKIIARAHSSPDIADTNEKIDLKPTGKYYALLIGNSDYSNSGGWTSLSSPINDINEIAKVLKKNYNFAKVEVLPNTTRDKLFKTLRNLKKVITPNDYLLIYYAGHGDQDANQAYWIPVNAGKEWDENWIDTVTITAAVSRIKTKHTLLMIDSCYVGTSFKGNDNEVSDKYRVSAKIAEKALLNRAGIVISSGSTTSVVDTAIDDKHSPFAYKFIDLLKNNKSFITSTKVFVELVEYHQDFKQTPQRYHVVNWGHLDGDFVFIRK